MNINIEMINTHKSWLKIRTWNIINIDNIKEDALSIKNQDVFKKIASKQFNQLWFNEEKYELDIFLTE